MQNKSENAINMVTVNDDADTLAENGIAVDEESVYGPDKLISGIVTNCLRLNVRKKPDPEAEVLTIIDALSEVVVDMNASTDKFYKVCTAAGIEGFCMKKYIAFRK